MKKVFTLFCLCALCVSSVWGETISMDAESGFYASYQSENKTLTISGVDFVYGGIMYNGKGTPTGFAKGMLMQLRKSGSTAGFIYNNTPISISNIKIYVQGTGGFSVYYGDEANPSTDQIAMPEPTSKTVECAAGTIENANCYEFDFTGKNASYFKIENGTKASYFYKIEITTLETKSFDITSAGYATAYVPFAATVTGATAYYVTVEGSSAKLHEIEGTIPANTGVVLKGTAETTATLTESAVAPTTDFTGNVLKGTLNPRSQAELGETEIKLIYVLNEVDGKVGFYHLDGTLAANRAYMEVAVGVGVKAFFFDEEATGIQNSQFTIHNSDVMYNLSGQVVGKDYKGIVIVNGKKMFNK